MVAQGVIPPLAAPPADAAEPVDQQLQPEEEVVVDDVHSPNPAPRRARVRRHHPDVQISLLEAAPASLPRLRTRNAPQPQPSPQPQQQQQQQQQQQSPHPQPQPLPIPHFSEDPDRFTQSNWN